jgi:hypothetical protein
MNQNYTHKMKISNIHESGAQEWLCLDCDRRILVSWTPAFKRIVLEPGDDDAVHTGSFGGIEITRAQAEKDNLSYNLGPVNGSDIVH